MDPAIGGGAAHRPWPPAQRETQATKRPFLSARPPNRRRQSGGLPRSALTSALMTSSTRNTMKSICAMLVAAPAMPPKPRNPAMSARTKKISAQYNIGFSFITPSRTWVVLQALCQCGSRLRRWPERAGETKASARRATSLSRWKDASADVAWRRPASFRLDAELPKWRKCSMFVRQAAVSGAGDTFSSASPRRKSSGSSSCLCSSL
jgi:hypothetical protein